jgi:hypothetical protein
MESINNLHANDQQIIQMIESLTITENTNHNTTVTTGADTKNTHENDTYTNNELNDATEVIDQTIN